MNSKKCYFIYSRLYNQALRIVNSAALQYFTCDEEKPDDASNLLKAMQDQERISFVRGTSVLSECYQDPWFTDLYGEPKTSRKEGNTSLANKSWLLRFPKLRPGAKPIIDSKVVELSKMSSRLDCSLMAWDDSESELSSCQVLEDGQLEDPFVWGLGCRDNRSLNFYVLDSVTQWSLVHKLGLAGLDHKVPKAVIISLNDDKIFAMDREFTSQNLQNFIAAFHGIAARAAAKDEQEVVALKQLKLSKKKPRTDEIHANNFASRLLAKDRKIPGM